MLATSYSRSSQVQRPQHASCQQQLQSAAKSHRVSRSCFCCSVTNLDELQRVSRESSQADKDTAHTTRIALRRPAVGFVAAVAAMDVTASKAAAAAAVTPVDPGTYVPGPVEVGWQIWFAAIISTVPFVIGAYEFGKRILIQRRCQVCGGSGLVQKGKYPKKCPECGGFFPWISWRMFLSANASPGNGGPLLQPRGQTSVFYTVPPSSSEAAKQQQRGKVVEDSGSQAATGGQQPVGAVHKEGSKPEAEQ